MTKLLRNYSTITLLMITFITAIDFAANGQGCSDAGFCTLSSFKPQADSTLEYKNSFALAVSYGIGDFNISYFSPYLEYSRLWSQRISVSARVYYVSASGSLTTTNGLSDLFLSSSYAIHPKTKATIGIKIPFTDGNLKYMDSPLPMNYQTSLGTFDLIAGISHSFQQLNLNVGLQQPLSQNSNQYLNSISHVNDTLTPYLSTNKFRRAGDIMLRATYSFSLAKDKIIVIPGIPPIYHLANDRFTNEAGNSTEINGSQGLTLNGILSILYTPHSRHQLEWNAGTPFVARDARPDGLTRKFVTALEYRVKF